MSEHLILDKSWTVVQQDLLSKWLLEIKLYIEINNECSKRYDKYDKLLNIPNIIINSLIATTTFATIDRTNEILWLEFAIGFASIFALIIATLSNFLNYGRLSEIHKNTSTMYNILKNDIEDQTSRPSKYRENATLYITRIKSEYNKLLSTNPQIPSDLRDKYLQQYCNNQLHIIANISDDDQQQRNNNEVQEIINNPPLSQHIRIIDTKSPQILEEFTVIKNNDISLVSSRTHLQEEFEKRLHEQYQESEIKRVNFELSKLNNV
jgi:arginine repressor